MSKIKLLCGLFIWALIQSGCSDGLTPGEGPGFATFDPTLTGDELNMAIQSIEGIDEDDVPADGTVTEECPSGGTESWTNQTDIATAVQTATYRFSNCGKTIMLRSESYAVVINGTENATLRFSSGQIQVSGDSALSFGGDIGFSAECTFEATYGENDGDFDGTGETNCLFKDNEGEELTFESSSLN